VTRKLLSAAATVVAALVIILVVGEIGLRTAGFSAPIWYQPDERLGWSMRPGAGGWFTKEGGAYAQVNRAGFRDVDHPLAKPAGAYRVAVLGDSVVEAFQVELKAAFWWQLQERLRGCPALRGREPQVLAFGVSGYGTAQQQLLLESTALRYQPDLVLLAFAPNDVRNNSYALEPENERPFFRVEHGELSLDASFRKRTPFLARMSPLYEAYRASSDYLRLVQLVQAARQGVQAWRQAKQEEGIAPPGIEPSTNVALFAPPRDAAWEEAWAVTERLIARMHQYVGRHQARLVVAPLTHSAQVHPDRATRASLEGALGVPDLFYIERRLAALGEREGFAVIPLAPELQQRAEAGNVYFHGFPNYRLGWGHWNEKGHAAAADILASRLCPLL
jgi:lysophospholipase L1-like esterase